MHDQHPVIEAMAQRQPIVALGEQIDHIGGILCFHFPFEAVHFVHIFRLVIAT